MNGLSDCHLQASEALTGKAKAPVRASFGSKEEGPLHHSVQVLVARLEGLPLPHDSLAAETMLCFLVYKFAGDIQATPLTPVMPSGFANFVWCQNLKESCFVCFKSEYGVEALDSCVPLPESSHCAIDCCWPQHLMEQSWNTCDESSMYCAPAFQSRLFKSRRSRQSPRNGPSALILTSACSTSWNSQPAFSSGTSLLQTAWTSRSAIGPRPSSILTEILQSEGCDGFEGDKKKCEM